MDRILNSHQRPPRGWLLYLGLSRLLVRSTQSTGPPWVHAAADWPGSHFYIIGFCSVAPNMTITLLPARPHSLPRPALTHCPCSASLTPPAHPHSSPGSASLTPPARPHSLPCPASLAPPARPHSLPRPHSLTWNTYSAR